MGVGAVALTGWQRLDPIVALAVAANIIWTGIGIVRRSTAGLMDAALSAKDQAAVQRVLETYQQSRVQFHKLQTLSCAGPIAADIRTGPSSKLALL